MFLLYFLQRNSEAQGMFFHDGVRHRSQFWGAATREFSHKAGPWCYGLAAAVRGLTFVDFGNAYAPAMLPCRPPFPVPGLP
jgi:hypothetical protein